MSSFLVDTDVCSAFLKGVAAVKDAWHARPATQIVTCSIVRGELAAGAWGTSDPHGMLARIDQLLNVHTSLPFNDRAAEVYGNLTGALGKTGRLVGPVDAMIAAIALANGLAIVTRNVRHFRRIPGLKVIRW